MIKGFHQIAIEESSKEKTAFSCEFGQFQFKRMPMGTRNSPSYFAKVVDKCLEDVPRSEITAYLDDLIVHSPDYETHLKNLQKFFKIMAINSLRLNSRKAVFCVKKVDFLGYEIENGSIKPSQSRVEAINDRGVPKDRDEAISLFGALSSHRRFIEGFAELALPISKTYRGKFQWTSEATVALEKLKKIITSNALKLSLPPKNCRFVLETDASETGYGGCLSFCRFPNLAHEHNESCLRQIAYHSGNFSETQARYVTVEKELFSGMTCMERWAPYLLFNQFDWIVDNSCLRFINSLKTSNRKIQRWIMNIQGFSFNPIQRKSKEMKISDYLSRSSPKQEKVDVREITFSEADLVDFQMLDPTLSEVFKFVKIDRWPNLTSDRKINFYKLCRENLKIQDGRLVLLDFCGLIRTCIPDQLVASIVRNYHEPNHEGIDICYKKICAKYVWPSMRESVTEFIRSCAYCQASKPNTHPNRPPLGKSETPVAPFQCLAIDLIGPLKPTDSDMQFCLTAVDLFSKKVYAEALSSKSKFEVLEKFKRIFFSIPHVPKSVLSDNGTEFFAIPEFLKSKGVIHKLSPPYHPQTNGGIEVVNRTIKSRLRAICGMDNWDAYLYQVVHAINGSIHSVSEFSPFQIETGVAEVHNPDDPLFRNYGQRIDIDFSKIKERIESEKSKRVEKFSNSSYIEYKIGDKVLMKNMLAKHPPFVGPFLICDKSPKSTWYGLKDPNSGEEYRRHGSDLRRFIEQKFDSPLFIDKNQEKGASSDLSGSRFEISPLRNLESEDEEDNFCFSTEREIITPSISRREREKSVTTHLPEAEPQPEREAEPQPEREAEPQPEREPELNENSEGIEQAQEAHESFAEVEFDPEINSNSRESEVELSVNLSSGKSYVPDSDSESDKSASEQSVDVVNQRWPSKDKNESSESEPDVSDKTPDPIPEQKPARKKITFSDLDTPENSPKNEQKPARKKITFSDLDTPENSPKNIPEKSPLEQSPILNDGPAGNLTVTSDSSSFDNQNLEQITETETQILRENIAPNLTSFDELDVSHNPSNPKKRERESSKDSNSAPLGKCQILDSDNFEIALPEESNRMEFSINFKLQNENKELFELFDRTYEQCKQNMSVEKGIFCKLSELSMLMLKYVAEKFNLEEIENNEAPELRSKIRTHIQSKFKFWKKASNGEFLFYGIFLVIKPTKLSDFNKTELKALAAFYDIKNVFHSRKYVAREQIDAFFIQKFPNHKRVKGELIFSPETAV